MGQPRPVIIALVINEDLRLVLHAPEGAAVNDPVPIAHIRTARRALGLTPLPATTMVRAGGIGGNVDKGPKFAQIKHLKRRK